MGEDVRTVTVAAPMAGTVVHLDVHVGAVVAGGDLLVALESMKMEHPVRATGAGTVAAVFVAHGDAVASGTPLLEIASGSADGQDLPGAGPASDDVEVAAADDGERDDLRRVHERRKLLADAARPEAVASRHRSGSRTARENIADLVDDGSFEEYGGLVVAAQRARRSEDELRATTPADGLVGGIATIGADRLGPEAARCVVLAYDATVLAGTQGQANHRKKDRLLRLAAEHRLPVVLFAEGGGGRPGDTDALGASWLDAEAFHLFAALHGRVPTVALVHGYCFAGNAALAGAADVIVATEASFLGMAGPAMIEGAGLGDHPPTTIGPIDVQRANGVVDVVVRDEAEAVAVARRFLDLVRLPRLPRGEVTAPDPRSLRDAVPEDRRRIYDVRALIGRLVDEGSLLELRRDSAPGMVTALARIDGRAVGLLANDPAHLGGAIDADAADSAVAHVELCDAHRLPVVVLCDTPGFMVGPEAEGAGGVRRFGRMFVAASRVSVPFVGIVTRKAYGLGAMAMLGGHLQVPVVTVGWPTAELGPMGLEGAVRLGFRRDLDAITDPAERAAREQEMITAAYAAASGLNVASFGEIDDVIDPADTRTRVSAALDAARW